MSKGKKKRIRRGEKQSKSKGKSLMVKTGKCSREGEAEAGQAL